MDKIKSSWEIAMERAAKMEVKPEELRKQLEEKCQLMATGFADTFLDSRNLGELKGEFEKRPPEETELIKKNLVQYLAAALKLGDYEKMPAIIDGIILATGNDKLGEIKGKLLILFDAYRNLLLQKGKEINIEGKEILEHIGVTGFAIKAINAAANKEWLRNINSVAVSFEKEFMQYKRELLAD